MKRSNRYIGLWKSVIRILFIILSGLLGIGQLQRLVLNTTTTIYWHDIVVALIIVCTIPLFATIKKEVWHDPIIRVLSIFVGILVITLAIAAIHTPLVYWIIGILYLLRLILYLFFGASCLLCVREKILMKEDFMKLTLFTTTIIAVVGLGQYYFIPDVRGLRLLGWDDHYLRLVSTLLDPAFTGLLLVFGLAIVIQKLLQRRTIFMMSELIIHVIALLLTYSRASYVATGVILATYFVQFKTARKMLCGLVLFIIAGMMVLPRPASEGARLERLSSVYSRVQNTNSALQNLNLKGYILGNGWYLSNATRQINNSLTTISHSSSPDNSYIHVLQSAGIGGLTAFLIWYGLLIYRAKQSVTRACLFAAGVAAFFNQVLFYPWVLLFLAQVMAQDEGFIA